MIESDRVVFDLRMVRRAGGVVRRPSGGCVARSPRIGDRDGQTNWKKIIPFVCPSSISATTEDLSHYTYLHPTTPPPPSHHGAWCPLPSARRRALVSLRPKRAHPSHLLNINPHRPTRLGLNPTDGGVVLDQTSDPV